MLSLKILCILSNDDILKNKYIQNNTVLKQNLTIEYKKAKICKTLDVFEACYHGYSDIIKYFVLLGINIRDNNDLALRYAAHYGHLDLVKYLIAKGADIEAYDNFAIKYAALNGHINVVKYLLSLGANYRAGNDFAIRKSAFCGHYEVFTLLFDKLCEDMI